LIVAYTDRCPLDWFTDAEFFMRGVSLGLGVGFLVFVLAAACSGGGSGDGDRSEENLRGTAQRFTVDLFDDAVDPTEVTQFFPRECREGAAQAVLLAGAAIGDADVELDITNVEFESEDRALVTGVLLSDGDPFGDGEAEAGLWVFEDGRWRNADDCEAFGT
jgi:hypothetical protein